MKESASQGQRKPRPPFSRHKQRQPGLESKLDPRPRFQSLDYREAGKLRDKVALITGGDSGIGRAVAVIYAREGADVAISFLSRERSDALVTRRAVEAAGRRCLLLPGNVTSRRYCDAAVRRTVRELGRLDILVSNAAHQTRKQSLREVSDREFDRTFKTNVYAYFWLARAALKHMRRGAVILATSSEAGTFGSPQLPDYSATKGAIDAFTKSLALAVLDRGIRVNAVAPGPVWTPLNPSDPGLPPKRVATFGSRNPMGRPAQPEEVAPAYVFLACEAESSYITGTVLHVMGGETTG
jgi:NAD(P)-dependent dehydrogenase (short-subunit alcohol dehydrogenase family)